MSSAEDSIYEPAANAVEPNEQPALPFPIVAIGASAGGLEALKRFFDAMPAGRGMAFVVLMHLDPRHESALPELIGRRAALPVTQARDGERVEPDRIYVIPPNAFPCIEAGVLHLDRESARPGVPHPIDHFLRVLARDQRERAICIILSGQDRDGAIGLKEIKAEGGMVMVQEPATAEIDSMPKSALSTQLVDYVLPVEEMPGALLEYVGHAGLAGPRSPEIEAHEEREELDAVLDVLRIKGGNDFRSYKEGMLIRRIRRRMGRSRSVSMRAYRHYLENTPTEIEALANDFLIGVTDFYRDPEAWVALAERVIPELLNTDSDTPVRAWIPACATGEEAYSLAMLMIEHAQAIGSKRKIQIFGTDINRQALERARLGEYPASISATVPHQRLRRFFTKTREGYRINRQIRELVLFAPQNLLTDPPFSRLDLVSCRNLLIYLEPSLQQRVLALFRFALNPHGYLFLGHSESIGPQSDQFRVVSKEARILQRADARTRVLLDFPIMKGSRPEPMPARAVKPKRSAHGELIRDLLLERYAPAAVLVNRAYHVVYSFGSVDQYLARQAGDPTDDLLDMARRGLRLKLRTVLHQVAHAGRAASADATLIRTGQSGEEALPVRINVSPAGPPGAPAELMLVAFEPLEVAVHDPSNPSNPSNTTPLSALPAIAMPLEGDAQAEVRQLEEELAGTKQALHNTIAELESTNEELKVSNEETMSMNEELQSANEELETSKEELQSLNEELTAVNAQLEDKIGALETANSDLNNLFSTTNIATLFLDRELRIKRYTEPTTRLFRLIPSDLHRPITDIAHQFIDGDLLEHAQRVLHEGEPREQELRTQSGAWHWRRTYPYRTPEGHIEGVVLTFADITPLKRAEEGLRRLATVMSDSNDAITVQDLSGRIIEWNRGAEAMYGYSKDEALGMKLSTLVPPSARAEQEELLRRVRAGEAVHSSETRRVTRDGRVREIWLTLSVLRDEAGNVSAIATTERDITERHRTEEELRRRAKRLEEADRRKDELLAMLAHELRNPLAPMINAARIMRHADKSEAQAQWAIEIIDRQSQHLKRLIDALLDVSRITRGKVRLQRAPIELQPVIQAAIDATRPLIESRRHTLSVALPSEPARVDGDATRLQQIFENLLSNAAKYTEEDGHIWLSAETIGSEIVVRVRDNGVGMSADLLPQVFDLFVQAERTVDRSQGGLGIGLTLVRRLTQLHGGRVEAKSGGPGRGSEFAVWLPLLTERRPSKPDAPAVLPDSPHHRVLVVDDNIDSAESLATLLALEGHETHIASSGPEALRLVASFRPRIVLLDIGMPDMDGFEVARRMKAMPELQSTIVIALTGYGGTEDRRRSKLAGFDHHLVKPVDPEALNALLRTIRPAPAERAHENTQGD